MFLVQINHTGKGFLFLIFREIKLRKYSSLHKLFYSLDFFNDIFGVTIVTNINYLYRKYILKKPKEKSKLLNDNVLLLRKRILTAIKNIDITSFATIQKSIIGIRNNFIQSGASQLNRLQIFKEKKINKAEISDLNKFFLFITEINFNSAKFIYEKNIF